MQLTLERLLDPATRGDPMSPLRWTCKSTPKLAAELQAQGHAVSQSTVWRLLASGTASIIGHHSAHDACVARQLEAEDLRVEVRLRL